MSIIWWTLYIIGALTIFVAWTQIMALIGTYLKARREKIEVTNSGMTRKDIESLVRMEIRSSLSNLEFIQTTDPVLGRSKVKIQMKEDK